MTLIHQPNNQNPNEDAVLQNLDMARVQTQPVSENYQEALQELPLDGTSMPLGEPPNATPELSQEAAFLSPLTALNPGHFSPYAHFSEAGYDNFSDYTTPGFGEELSDIAIPSMLSLDENQDNASIAETYDTGLKSDSTSKERNSSVGDSVTHPSTRLLSPILTNTPSPNSQQALSRTNTLNDISVEPVPIQSAYVHSGFVDQTSTVMSSSSRRGVNPDARNNINKASIPSLEDQAKQFELDKTKAGVEEWLTTTNTNEMISPSQTQSQKVSHHQPLGEDEKSLSLGNCDSRSTTTPVPDISSTPGPGLYLKGEEDDTSDDEDNDEDDIEGEDLYQSNPIEESTPPAPYSLDTVRATPSDASGGPLHTWNQKPWTDSPFDPDSVSLRGQPYSSNAAIARFERRAKDIETASQTATIASSFRRRSLESLFSAANISVVPPSEADTNQASDRGREKWPGLFGKILPKRSTSNLRKRKEGRDDEETAGDTHTRKESQGSTSSMKRVSSWGRTKSPSVGAASNIPPHLSTANRSSTNLTISTGPWSSVANVIKRARSRSDLSQSSALAEQWRSQGGPPVANLRPSEDSLEQSNHLSEPTPAQHLQRKDSGLDEDEDGEHTPTGLVEMSMSALDAPSAPTPDAFKAHASTANPHMELFMLERVTSEQLKRYRRLVEQRLKHANQVRDNNCPSRGFCAALRGGPKLLNPRRAGPDSDGPAVTFYINRNIQDAENLFLPEDDSIPASFPEGIPSPPAGVHRLPAEFECPLCFQVKKILKPSDWTKHVHEDLQPFTCSFPECGEPKSFKRKADWVRHENERHRQLEKWICNFPDCHHTCYRKDNFVQHLVREHKLPEPRLRASKSTAKSGNPGNEQNKVAVLIETCRHDTTRKAGGEACRFCGNYLTTWKKLSAHLAKHMEQLSLPVLTLAQQADLDQTKLMSPVDQELSYTRQASTGLNSNRGADHLPAPRPNYDSSSVQEIQAQQFRNGQTANLAVESQSTDFASQHQQQLSARLGRPNSASFPGTRNLPRDPSPYEGGNLVADTAFLSGGSFGGSGQHQLFTGQQASFGNLGNPSAASQAHNTASTYPPPFLAPPTSQPQSHGQFTQASLYPNAPLYTNSPILDANFSPDTFSPPASSVQSLYQYPQQALQNSPGQYSDRGAASYPPPVSHPGVGVSYIPYSQDDVSQYSTSGLNTYPGIPYTNGQPHSQGPSGQGIYLNPTPSEIQNNFSNANAQHYGGQSSGNDQDITSLDQQRQQQSRYY